MTFITVTGKFALDASPVSGSSFLSQEPSSSIPPAATLIRTANPGVLPEAPVTVAVHGSSSNIPSPTIQASFSTPQPTTDCADTGTCTATNSDSQLTWGIVGTFGGIFAAGAGVILYLLLKKRSRSPQVEHENRATNTFAMDDLNDGAGGVGGEPPPPYPTDEGMH